MALVAGAAHAQTAIHAGLWEVTDNTTLEGVQPMPATSKRVCVKGGEAILERLLYPTPDDFAKHGCTFTPGAKQPGVFKAKTVCPAKDQDPGVTAEAEVSYTPDSYERSGSIAGRGQGRDDPQGHQRPQWQAGRRLLERKKERDRDLAGHDKQGRLQPPPAWVQG